MATTDADRLEISLLSDQLVRMRGMLYGYSDLFFRRIRDWTLVTLALLVLGWSGIAPPAVVVVPFLVPFAFLETGYLYVHTLFARRFADRLERRINALVGGDVLIAHRLEAAFFQPLEAPKVAAFSFGRPAGFVSAATVGYTAGAALLWAAGFSGLLSFSDGQTGVGALLPLVAATWTMVIAAYLIWTFLSRHDESRLVAELDRWTAETSSGDGAGRAAG